MSHRIISNFVYIYIYTYVYTYIVIHCHFRLCFCQNVQQTLASSKITTEFAATSLPPRSNDPPLPLAPLALGWASAPETGGKVQLPSSCCSVVNCAFSVQGFFVDLRTYLYLSHKIITWSFCISLPAIWNQVLSMDSAWKKWPRTEPT